MSVKGSFYFKITNAGNVIGKYFKNYGNIFLYGGANRTDSGSGFAGNYTTSWIERQNSAWISRLTVEAISENMFSLVWTDLNNEIIFRGKASLLEENIIYGYHSGKQFIQEH